MIDTSQLLS